MKYLLLLLLSFNVNAAYLSEIVFFKNPQTPIIGEQGGNWTFNGAAATANTSYFPAAMLTGAHIKYARFHIAWNPMAGASWKGLELIMFTENTANSIVTLSGCQFLINNWISPRTNACDVTSQLQGLIMNGTSKYLAIRTVGDGVSGILLYSAQITIVWE